MRREPEVDTMTSRRPSTHIRRQSTRDEDMSSYSIHGHLANVCETNGSGRLQRQRSMSPCRRGSIRMARKSSSRVDRVSDNDEFQTSTQFNQLDGEVTVVVVVTRLISSHFTTLRGNEMSISFVTTLFSSSTSNATMIFIKVGLRYILRCTLCFSAIRPRTL